MPPVRLANHSAAWLAIGMNVGLGRSGSCSVCSQNDAERPFARTQRDRVVERLHHEDDDRAPRPVLGEQHLCEAPGVAQDLPQQLQRPRHARAVAGQQRVEQAHRVAAVAVGDGLDVRVRVGVDRGGDRHPLDQVVGVVLGHGHGRIDSELVRTSSPRRAEMRGSDPVQAAALQQPVGAQRPGRHDHAASTLHLPIARQPRARADAFDLVALATVGRAQRADVDDRCVRA